MRLYKITWQDRDHGSCTAWEGTQADAKAKVKALKAQYGTEAVYAGPEWAEHEVPTGKPELLVWLNQNVTRENG